MAKEQKRIIVVDDNSASLTACKNILKQHFEVFPVLSAAKLFELLEHIMPDLILLDVDMPEINGYEAAGRLKKDKMFSEIPIIFISGRVDPQSETFGLNMGAVDYIHKPFVSELLLKRIETHLSLIECQKSLEERNKPILEICDSLKEIIHVINSVRDFDDPGMLKTRLDEAGNMSKQLLSFLNDVLVNNN